jgi:hypothetical protein
MIDITQISVLSFSLIFFIFLLRQAKTSSISVYDFILFSLIFLIPLFFIFFEDTSKLISGYLGIEFPFVLLFSVLILALFIIAIRLTIKLFKLRETVVKLIQKEAINKIDD